MRVEYAQPPATHDKHTITIRVPYADLQLCNDGVCKAGTLLSHRLMHMPRQGVSHSHPHIRCREGKPSERCNDEPSVL